MVYFVSDVLITSSFTGVVKLGATVRGLGDSLFFVLHLG